MRMVDAATDALRMGTPRTVRAATKYDCQVLIVGAGPTGLALACELLALGVTTRIVEKNDAAVLETRALSLHARKLEALDSMGLVDRFLERGQKVRWFRYHSDGKLLAKLEISRSGSRFGFMLNIPQHETELLLRTRVAELGGIIEESVELIGFRQDSECVMATLKNCAGQTRTVSAEYLVGCDGARSRVRHELGLPFDGHPYPQDWLLADVLVDWSRSEDSVQALFRSDGTALIGFPMRDHRWRLVVPYAGDRGQEPPTLEEFQDLVDRRLRSVPCCPIRPGWPASAATAVRRTPTVAIGCSWREMPSTFTVPPAARG